MKPEFSKPFCLFDAKAGAPYCCENGEEATVMKWDCNHQYYPLIGFICENGFHYPESWTASGIQASDEEIERRPGRDLVMLPLGIVNGKSVFVGDKLEQRDRHNEAWIRRDAQPGERYTDNGEVRWPAPAKVYPETTISPDFLRAEYNSELGGKMESALRRVANAALRHAIDSGSVITKADHEVTMFQLGENLRPVADAMRAERDMAVAQAIRQECVSVVPVHYGERMGDLNLAGIISRIK